MLNTEGLCLGCMSDNGGEKICPICGYDNSSTNPQEALPLKAVLINRYLLGKVTDIDGEGITYIAWDNARTAKVKIKEYFPGGFAKRNPDKTVSPHENGKYTFNEGLLDFIEINRAVMAAAFPSLISVYDVFEENGTAFSVMEYVSGITLEEFLERNGGTLKWEQARPLFLPVIDTVGGMNELGFIHGGISSETIIVGRDGKLRISGYGIKKLRVTNSEIEYKIYGGYAACEQYGVRELSIDTYTDVYGLCATLFRVLIGVAPPEAAQRIHSDVMTIPSKFAEELPRQVLAALANGLQVMPNNRTRDIETFKNQLVYGEIEEPVTVKQPEKTVQSTNVKKKSGSTVKYVLVSAVCTVVVLALIGVLLATTVFKDAFRNNTSAVSSTNTPSIIAPVVDSIGQVDSGAEVTAKLYEIPDLKGKYYSEIIEEKDYEMFEFVIKNKEYSSLPKGTVCKQSKKAGTEAVRDTKIQLTLSLGPKEISIAKLTGLTEDEAKLELLKQGFLYENIIVEEKYDEDSGPGVVLEQFPAYGDKVNNDVAVEIIINSYKGDVLSDQGNSENGGNLE